MRVRIVKVCLCCTHTFTDDRAGSYTEHSPRELLRASTNKRSCSVRLLFVSHTLILERVLRPAPIDPWGLTGDTYLKPVRISQIDAPNEATSTPQRVPLIWIDGPIDVSNARIVNCSTHRGAPSPTSRKRDQRRASGCLINVWGEARGREVYFLADRNRGACFPNANGIPFCRQEAAFYDHDSHNDGNHRPYG